MHSLRQLLAKIPLVFRVVSLYVVVGTPIVMAHNLLAPEPVLTSLVREPIVSAIEQGAGSERVDVISGQPVRIEIERAGINLPIQPGVYDAATHDWTLSDDKVQFATITASPNNIGGNTFLYGHNTWSVLRRTSALQIGDLARVTTDNGHVFTYRFTGDDSVTPTSTDALRIASDAPRMTLMTCQGVWSESRRLMYFDLVGVGSHES